MKIASIIIGAISFVVIAENTNHLTAGAVLFLIFSAELWNKSFDE